MALNYAERLMIEANMDCFCSGILCGSSGWLKEPPKQYTRSQMAAWWLGHEFYLAWQSNRQKEPVNVTNENDPDSLLAGLIRVRNERARTEPVADGGNARERAASSVSAQFVPSGSRGE